jgi:hypothetical protein
VVGERIELAAVSIEVLEITTDARPLRVAFRFPTALEDPSLRWVEWDGHGLAPAAPPAIGVRERVEGRVLWPF